MRQQFDPVTKESSVELQSNIELIIQKNSIIETESNLPIESNNDFQIKELKSKTSIQESSALKQCSSDSTQQVEITLCAEVRLSGDWTYEKIAKHFIRIEELLYQNGITSYTEPYSLKEKISVRCETRHLSTSWFSAFQQFYGFSLLTTLQKDHPNHIKLVKLDEEDVLDLALQWFPSSHLLCHATEGYYLPIDFNGAPLFDPEGKIPGGWLGSTYRLLEELIQVSIQLDISLSPLKGVMRRSGGYDISEESIIVLNNTIKDNGPLWKEKMVWFALYECARLSIKYGTALALR